jgi:hypothetical protein
VCGATNRYLTTCNTESLIGKGGAAQHGAAAVPATSSSLGCLMGRPCADACGGAPGNRPVMPDDHSELVPPLPIPNRTVKRLSADDSAATSVKVGHRQAVTPENPRRPTATGVFAFGGVFACKIKTSECPSCSRNQPSELPSCARRRSVSSAPGAYSIQPMHANGRLRGAIASTFAHVPHRSYSARTGAPCAIGRLLLPGRSRSRLRFLQGRLRPGRLFR